MQCLKDRCRSKCVINGKRSIGSEAPFCTVNEGCIKSEGSGGFTEKFFRTYLNINAIQGTFLHFVQSKN